MKPSVHGRRLVYVCLQATREGQASHAHVHEIIRGLERRGWEVLLFEPGYANEPVLPGLLRRAIEFLLVQLRALRSIWSADILYVRGHPAGIIVAVGAWLVRVPTVQEVNGPYEDLFIAYPGFAKFARVLRPFMRLPYRIATGLVAVTPQLAAWVKGQAPQVHARTISNGADVERFHPEAAQSRFLPEPYVVFVGALARWQGVEVMLDAITSSAWPDGVQLVVVGDGAGAGLVRAASRKSARVNFLGQLPYRDVPGVIARSIAALSPQTNVLGRSETGLAPLKLFEAMACGVPVIVSDVPHQADLVRKHECGIVIPAGDHKALARAVATLAGAPDLGRRMGRNGRSAAAAAHSWDHRAAETSKFLAELLGLRDWGEETNEATQGLRGRGNIPARPVP